MKFLIVSTCKLLARIVSIVPRREANSVVMLGAASGVAFALLASRIVISGRLQHLYLPWNLFLAWVPLGFAVVSLRLGERWGWRHWKPWTAAAGWMLLLPNAPYIFTDLVHLGPVHDARFWVDMILILLFAWPGFLVGCVALRMMHRHVARTFSERTGWVFALGACGLAGLGVYIGRFQRWNSWDALINPIDLAMDISRLLTLPIAHPAYRFSILFGMLFFIGYATVHAQQQGTTGWLRGMTRTAN